MCYPIRCIFSYCFIVGGTYWIWKVSMIRTVWTHSAFWNSHPLNRVAKWSVCYTHNLRVLVPESYPAPTEIHSVHLLFQFFAWMYECLLNLSLLVTFNESLGAVGSVMLLIFVLHSISFIIKIHHQTTAIITYILSLTFHNVSTSYSNLDDTMRIPSLLLQRLEFFDQRSALILSTPKLRASKNCWWNLESLLLHY